jgi:5S rRNA maturation endonuclease (ribonuclease M5)
MGKLDLNSIIFNEHLTKQDVLQQVTQEEIYSFYTGESITGNTILSSPLREDNVPSFALFYHRNEPNVLMFKDFATKETGDVIVFVSKLFAITYYQALLKIAYDFNLSSIEMNANRNYYQGITRITRKEQILIEVKNRNWKIKDRNYWEQFGIKKDTLIKYNVFPIEYVFFNSKAYKTDSLSYAYAEFKDDVITYKIYQPYNLKFKWINNANYSVHQGYSQLPSKGDLLIITKSLKDVMSLRDVVKIPAIGLQSESVMMKDSVMEEYKSRFSKVICLFDNDEAGKKLADQFCEHFKIPFMLIPENFNSKDFSDLIKNIGIERGRKTFLKELKKII